MKEIICTGTIHLNWTPENELVAVLNELEPDLVFAELSLEELQGQREESIRDEMFFAYDWAIKKSNPGYSI